MAPQRITVPKLVGFKAEKRPIAMITAYDYPTAQLVDEAGADAVLVGDSLSMVVQGHENTLPVTLEEMIYHAEMVGRAVQRALVIVDMPFPTYHTGSYEAIANAGRILKETRCQAVKLEGGADQAETIAALTSAGIPVMAHVGLRPQNIHQMGEYRVQRDQARLLADAQAAEAAGAFSIVLECIPNEIARQITETVSIPTIGIGAGDQCDGQVLVFHDVVGLTSNYVPRFVKQYANLNTQIRDAVEAYCDDVRQSRFPSSEQSYK